MRSKKLAAATCAVVEQIERRVLLSAVLGGDGTLTVTGTAVNDVINVSLGVDEVDLIPSVDVSVTVNGSTQSFSGTSIKRVVVNALAGNDTVHAQGEEQINATSAQVPFSVFGGDGNDAINDQIIDDNHDLLAVSLDGGAGNDTLSGGEGRNTLSGGAGNDELADFPDESALVTMNGGAGNDTLLSFDSTASDMSGGDGIDTADFSLTSGNVRVTLDNVANDGGGLNNHSDNVRTDVENIVATGDTNYIVGSAGPNAITIAGGAGDTTVLGGGGNDTISVDSAFGATVSGGAGDDSITVSAPGAISVDGGDGNDFILASGNGTASLTGGTGNDTIVSENAVDADDFLVTMQGGDGNDALQSITSGTQHIQMSGGNGNDTFHKDDLDSKVTISGGAGTDTILLKASDATFNSEVIGLDGATHAPGDFFAQSDVENVTGTFGGSSLKVIGNASNNVFNIAQPGGGHMTLLGQAGDDVLSVSGSEAQSLYGGDGNDTLRGGHEPDFFSGGNGSGDVVDYSNRTANLTIGIGTIADDGEAGEHDNVFLDVERVYGGSGNDSIKGSAANNALFGNGGNDTLIGGGGVDALFGGAGNDSIDAKDGLKDYVDGGPGNDSAKTDTIDTVVNVETVTH